MMTYFEQDPNKNLALVTSYRVRIDDHGNLIGDSHQHKGYIVKTPH